MMAPERPSPEDEVGVAAMRGAVSIADLPVFALHGGQLRELKEGDGAMVEVAALHDDQADKPAGEDNDLTSLSWLHDKNLLKEMNLTQPGSQESPTSDFADETGSEPADSTCSSGPSPPTPPPPAPQRHKHPTHMPYDPQVHTSSKPPYSFSCLIFMAIEDSAARALPVKDIYTWVLEHFPYFKSAPTGWKNSVRHNLSLNKCFRKVEKAPNLGKGSLWMVDPTYRPNLLQALQKAPFHPYTTLDRINMVTSRHPNGSGGGGGGGGRSEGRGGGAGRMPDPELFPFLARRLAASAARPASPPRPPRRGSDSSGADMDDDVCAATAIMQLKHGSRMAISRRGCADSWLSRRKSRPSRAPASPGHAPCAPPPGGGGGGGGGPVVTTSPSEDHTYSAAGSVVAVVAVNPSCSPDEAFADGSDSDSWVRRRRSRYPSHSDSEEQRKIAEGADALLNLAGITTTRRFPECPPRPPPRPAWPGESSPPPAAAAAAAAAAGPPRRPRKRPAPSPSPPPPPAAPAFRPRILRASRKRHGRKRKPINNNSSTALNGNVRTKPRDWLREARLDEKKPKGRR